MIRRMLYLKLCGIVIRSIIANKGVVQLATRVLLKLSKETMGGQESQEGDMYRILLVVAVSFPCGLMSAL